MDLHAHLLRTEVIGLLGGKFDATANQIDILTAFPCRGASTDFQVSSTICIIIDESIIFIWLLLRTSVKWILNPRLWHE
jgi:hypothetical protein